MNYNKLLIIAFVFFLSGKAYGVSLNTGSLSLDNGSTEKSICFNNESGNINFTGHSVKPGTGQFISWWKTTTNEWQISCNNVDFTAVTSSSGSSSLDLSGLTRTIWVRKSIKVEGVYGSVFFGALFGFIKDGYTNTVKINVYSDNTPGSISGNQTICYNTTPSQIYSTANPSGGAGATTYSWENSTNSTDWDIIAGATSSSYTPPSLTQTTYYRRIATNTCGSVNTSYVAINVRDELISSTISSSQTICYTTAPSPLTGTSPTGGIGTYTYQWEKSNNNVTFSSISAATSVTYSPPALTTGTYYRLKSTSGSCGSVYSNTLTISVNGQLLGGSISGNQTIFYNTAPSVLNNVTTATGGTGIYSYQWQSSLNNSTYTNIASATNSSLTPSALTQTTYFRRKVTSGSCGSAYSNVITVIVYNDLNAGVIGDEQYICYNTNPNPLRGEQASGGSGTYSYQWQMSLDGTNWNNAVNGTGQNYSPGTLTRTTFYRRSVISPPDTRIKYSNEVMILVYPQISPGVIGSNQTVCYNTRPVTLMGSDPTGGVGEYNFQWYKSTDQVNFEPILLANSDMYSPDTLIVNTYYKREVVSGECGSAQSNVVSISVLNPITPGAVGNSQTICYNTIPATLNGELPTGGTGSYAYKWQNSPDGDVFNDIALASSQTYNPTSLAEPTYFRRSVTSGDCGTVYSNQVLINVYPELNGGTITGSQSICYDTLPSVFTGELPTGGTGSYTYKWDKSENGLSWEDIFLADDYFFQEGAKLTTSTFYKRIATSGSCGSAESNIITVNVFDKMQSPIVDIDSAYCKGSDIILKVKNPNTQYDYIWDIDDDENIVNELTVYDLKNSIDFDVRANYEQKCESPRSSYALNLDPVKADFKADAVEVKEGSGLLFKNLSENASTYLWEFEGEGTSVRENPWHYFYEPGLKSVTLIASSVNNCSDTLTRKDYIIVDAADSSVTAINNLLEDDNVLIYPNPVVSGLNVEFLNYSGSLNYDLVNESGILMLEKSSIGSKDVFIDMSGLTQGIYLLRIYRNSYLIITKKIIKR